MKALTYARLRGLLVVLDRELKARATDHARAEAKLGELARHLRLERPTDMPRLAEVVARRCDDGVDAEVAHAIDDVLRQPRPVSIKLDFIERHLMPHLEDN